ncbi:aspartyl-phosphate phosphatase Spo0E family protein [Clostridium cuniculi]|uniref:aspartyl-phosphate phosphatase Spo0E family protein n=1 Tax=Clostridium cuniculi TaxID=2548455 RepID=UPI001054CA20|nr:aspartyl-phosphate phosphatase Spo0E family protein [Clostridium cuniculi]
MKELREQLHKAIDEYGITDERTIAISQQLDNLVCKIQTILLKKYKQERNVH